jgi:hypothetical protein
VKRFLRDLVLHELCGIQVAVTANVANDRQVIDPLQRLPETVLVTKDLAEQVEATDVASLLLIMLGVLIGYPFIQVHRNDAIIVRRRWRFIRSVATKIGSGMVTLRVQITIMLRVVPR